MQVTETLSDGLKRAYTVVVPATELESRRTARLTDLGKTLRLPGFRPGKVPMTIVRQRYGTAVTAEVLQESVDEATQQVISDRGLRPAMQPKVNVTAIDEMVGSATRDLEFNVELELMPEIAMPDFAALALTRLRAEVAPDSVDKALTELASRNRELTDVEEERGAEKGEMLTVDFLGKVDGEPFPGGEAKDMPIEVGGDGFIPGFTEQLEGMRAGEQKTIAVSFPPEYGAANLAGKDATFDITAKKLQKPAEATVGEDLATKLGFENLAELRQLLTDRMQREYDQLSRLRLKRQLLDALAERADFAPPQGMVDAEFAQIWERIETDRKAGRLDADDAAKDEDTLRTEYRAIADRRVRLGLLLAEIGRVNGITVTTEELTRAMRAEAMRYPGQEAQVMEFFRKNPQMTENLRGPIFEEKVVDYVIELASVTDETVTPEELARDPDEGGNNADEAASAGAAGEAGSAEAPPPA